MTRKYEVQFKDGSGAWRRWSLKDSRESADRSHARLLDHFGRIPARETFARIIEVNR